MNKEIIADINDHQTRVATLEDGELIELFIERRGKERIVGNIYMGRVQNVLPGMQAAFVDIGLERNAFLYAGDILVDVNDMEFPDRQGGQPSLKVDIRDVVKRGQEVMVQILKEPVGTKGARVTTHITLPGRTLVLMPTVDYIGVSKRIENEIERARLRDALEKLRPEKMGVIVRTAAIGCSEEKFEQDLLFLLKLWERIEQQAKTSIAPKSLHNEEPLVFRTIRDLFSDDVTRLVINDQAACEKLKVVVDILAPNRKNCVELFQKNEDIFDYYGLTAKIERLLQRKIWLKSGGYLVVDQTEALTVVDVNTGKFVGEDDLQKTILQTNLEAAKEIARQLRLRDIGGIIIIDFIDMSETEDREQLIRSLQDALKHDPTKSNVVGMTGLGLIEMTRKKVRKSLSATMEMSCSHCRGTGLVLNDESVSLNIRKKMLEQIQHYDREAWLITARESVITCLQKAEKENNSYLPEGFDIYVRSVTNQNDAHFQVQPVMDSNWLNKCAPDAKKL